ncbi:periplasmic solute binding family protein [Candidatus Nitrosopumilus salaria BD31]|uniref:Periplasmic solute binding family protein n=1 Tax=Candidatus Nitrosopumilus salarius BD31 TaxID=859350 RepID=I3D3F0_9ARCH|nr:metal ABC transporter substrate-binding protein [Candidatus Nitrosopumilus salaria]EIJ66243.1 periplasmic solute binding family protein [Candidatus Nitrosopumilus salaria BD31]
MNLQIKLAIIAIITVIPLSSIVVYGTNSDQRFTTIDNSKLQVISSFNPLYEFSKNIGQEKVDVVLLLPVGVEPHDWEPTIKDVQRMQKSDLIIINGIGFENWVNNLQETNYSGKIIDTSLGIPTMNSNDEHFQKSTDPHIWLNPVYAKIQVQNIADAFSQSDPKNEQYYQSNAAKYLEKLNSLDSKIRDELSGCNHDFVSFHNAFSYFADEYNLNQHTIISSNDSHGEVTAKTLENIISTSRELDLKVIFSEENIDTRTSNIIANEIGGKVLILSPLEVSSDETYISKMTQNLENLKEALC